MELAAVVLRLFSWTLDTPFAFYCAEKYPLILTPISSPIRRRQTGGQVCQHDGRFARVGFDNIATKLQPGRDKQMKFQVGHAADSCQFRSAERYFACFVTFSRCSFCTVIRMQWSASGNGCQLADDWHE